MEPITFTAILAALSAGVATGVGKALGENSLVDAYERLKVTLKRRFGDDSEVVEAVDKLERDPESEGRKVVMKEEVEKAGADQDPEVCWAAQQLLEQLKTQPGGEQHIQYAKGTYIAQADRGGQAKVNVNRRRSSDA